MHEETGMIDVPGGRVWFRRLGEGGKLPLLVLHGGPGAASYYLEPFAERMARSRPVVVWDQLGCGRSESPDDPSLWTLDRSCAELDEVRRRLGLERCHMLGQSWGGWLSIEYFARGTSGVQGLVLASTSASMPEFVAAAHVLIDHMPEPWRGTLNRLGELGAYDDPAYQEAVMEFYRRHLCRLDPWPQAVVDSMSQMDNQIYRTMNGPNEFDVIGPLGVWDRVADLGCIRIPTLVTVGAYDEITPSCARTIVAGIEGARLEVFEQSAHMAHEEEPERYAAVVSAFLDDVDARTEAQASG